VKNTERGLETYTLKACEKDGEKLEGLIGFVIVGEVIIMTGGGDFISEVLLKNPIKLEVPKIEDKTRIYDKNHY